MDHNNYFILNNHNDVWNSVKNMNQNQNKKNIDLDFITDDSNMYSYKQFQHYP